jgi:hypothetical protein
MPGSRRRAAYFDCFKARLRLKSLAAGGIAGIMIALWHQEEGDDDPVGKG